MPIRIIPAKPKTQEKQKKPSYSWFLGAFGLGLLIFLCLPTHFSVRVQAIAAPAQQAYVGPQISGTVVEIFASTGDWVSKGAPLLRLHNPSVEANLAVAQANLSLAKLHSAYFAESSQAQEEEQAPLANLELKNAWAELQSAELAYNELLLKSPLFGEILPIPGEQGLNLHLDDLKGLFVAEGSRLIRIANTHEIKLLIPLNEQDASLLCEGAPLQGQWISTGDSFESVISQVPQCKAKASEYLIGFQSQFGGPAPQQDLSFTAGQDPSDYLFPLFIAEAAVPGDNSLIRDQMRAIVDIQGQRTRMIFRLWKEVKNLLKF